MGFIKSGVKLLFIALLLVTAGCGSSGNVNQQSTDQMTLEDHLRRLNGVRITGSGEYAKVVLRPRGISNASRGMGVPESKKDINLGDSNQRQPLFVVDGQKIGRDYPFVRDMFARGEIKSVKLLSDSEASQYGSQNGYGVIEIITDSSGNNK